MKQIHILIAMIIQRRITAIKLLPIASISALAIGATPAGASAVFLPATDEIKFISDGNQGIFVEYASGKKSHL